MKTIKRIGYFLLTFTITLNLQAQITMGVEEKPAEGALLQLKNKSGVNDGGINADKGLGLPRVNLNSLTIPSAAGKNLSVTIDGTSSTEDWDKDEHIGLVIYNVKEDLCADNPIYKGVYVFDGTQWRYLAKELASGVSIFTDPRDGEKYHTRKFGTAGEWMLENLRYNPEKNPDSGFPSYTHNSARSYTDKYYCYPQPFASGSSEVYNPTQAETDWHKRNGLLYNWPAATNKENTITTHYNQGQMTAGALAGINEVENLGFLGSAPNKYFRGICPEGWHLPSDREWNNLEKELYDNPAKYSSYDETSSFTPANWNSDWEYGTSSPGTGWRGPVSEGHGKALLSPCGAKGSNYTAPNGKSNIPQRGGFNILLTGFVLNNSIEGYGVQAYFWQSSSIDTDYNASIPETHGWLRTAYYNYAAIARGFTSGYHMVSVRCKKND